MFVELKTEVAKYTNLKSIKQNQAKAKCLGLEWSFLPTKWSSAKAKVMTVSSGMKESSMLSFVNVPTEVCHHGFVTPWFLRTVISQVRMD